MEEAYLELCGISGYKASEGTRISHRTEIHSYHLNVNPSENQEGVCRVQHLENPTESPKQLGKHQRKAVSAAGAEDTISSGQRERRKLDIHFQSKTQQPEHPHGGAAVLEYKHNQ